MNSDIITTAVDYNVLSASLALLDEIPPMDTAVQRLIEVMSNEDISERQLAAIIDDCPSLSGRIVGLANSAYFRRSKPIHSLPDAIFLIGMRTVKSFAIATALQAPFANDQCPAFRPGLFWLHDVLTAQAARALSQKAPKKLSLNPEEAYLAGLLHNIGLLALAHLFPEQLNQLLEAHGRDHAQLTSSTEITFGANYQSIGAALLKHWHLPVSFIDSTRHFANPDYDGDYWAQSQIVGVAAEWATHIINQETASPFNFDRLAAVEISKNDAEAVRAKCLEQLDGYIELSEIISGTKVEFAQSDIVTHATIELKDRLVDAIDSLSSIRALTDLNIRNKSENEILKDSLKILMEHQEMQRCSIFLLKDRFLKNAAGLSWDEHFTDNNKQNTKIMSKHVFALGEGILGMVAKTGEMKHAQNCAADPLFKAMDQVAECIPGSLICVPISFQETILGVLNISHSEANVFTEWHERFLLVFANMLGQLIIYNRVMRGMDDKINQRTRELQVALAHAETLSTHDELTGIHNRRYFIDHFSKMIQQSERYHYTMAVLMIDIDNFKVINDTFGHVEGDRTLIKVASVLGECAREADVIARLGGEEFIIALQHTDCKNAQQVAQRVLDKIRQLKCGEDNSFHITASIGISCCDEVAAASSKTTEKWIQEADKALYQAKNSGKDRIVTFH